MKDMYIIRYVISVYFVVIDTRMNYLDDLASLCVNAKKTERKKIFLGKISFFQEIQLYR